MGQVRYERMLHNTQEALSVPLAYSIGGRRSRGEPSVLTHDLDQRGTGRSFSKSLDKRETATQSLGPAVRLVSRDAWRKSWVGGCGGPVAVERRSAADRNRGAVGN